MSLLVKAEGEKQKSIERPVINSFTVIKTLESLKGVGLLMSCDIFRVPKTVLSLHALPSTPTTPQSAELRAFRGRGSIIKERGRKRKMGRFHCPRMIERGGNNEISGLCEK